MPVFGAEYLCHENVILIKISFAEHKQRFESFTKWIKKEAEAEMTWHRHDYRCRLMYNVTQEDNVAIDNANSIPDDA